MLDVIGRRYGQVVALVDEARSVNVVGARSAFTEASPPSSEQFGQRLFNLVDFLQETSRIAGSPQPAVLASINWFRADGSSFLRSVGNNRYGTSLATKHPVARVAELSHRDMKTFSLCALTRQIGMNLALCEGIAFADDVTAACLQSALSMSEVTSADHGTVTVLTLSKCRIAKNHP
jgi:hypothetical protein